MERNSFNHGFIGRPTAALCVAAALVCVGAIVIFERGRLGAGALPQDLYTVSLKHYGMDAREMERSVTVPLEDALYALPDARQVTSVSDNGQSRVSVLFEAGSRGSAGRDAGRYEAVSDAAQRVYAMLPESAQRPEILSRDDNRAPVWTAAVTGDASMGKARLAAFLERTVKGELEAVEGVAEAQVAGAALSEVLVSLDNERCAEIGLAVQNVAAALARNDVLIPAGSLAYHGTEINLLVDGRYRDTDELSGAFIPLPEGGYTRLEDIAAVTERERQPDILSRLNGEQTVMLIVTASHDADLGKLSGRLKAKMERYENLSFEILADRGAEERKALRSVIAAAAGGALMVAALSFLMTAGAGGIRPAAVCALTVPFIGVLSLALLSLIQPLNKSVLTGLAAGLGVAVDAAILVSEKLSGLFAKPGNMLLPAAKKRLRALVPPLAAGSATTVAALMPFVFLKNAAGEIKAIAVSIGVITVVSFFTALVLLPPLFLNGGRRGAGQRNAGRRTIVFMPGRNAILIPGKIIRAVIRSFSRIVYFSVKKPLLVTALSVVLTAAALIVVITSEPDTRSEFSEDSLYAQVEFDGGLLKEDTDRKLAEFARELRQNDAVKHVETSAKTGQGNVSVSFDKKKTNPEKIREFVRNIEVPGGFVYIEELTGSERSWQISVSGDDDALCREIIEKMAEVCAGIPLVEETVLHFKKGGPRLALKPDRERLASAGLSFASIGDTERRAVHAPVVYKRLNSADETGARGETDVRIQAGLNENPDKADVQNITLMTSAGTSLALSSVAIMEEKEEVSVIRREGRRRTASLSVRTKAIGAHKARSLIMPRISAVTLPPGYTAVFDRDAIEAEEALGKSAFHIVLALLFCYIVIAMANESFYLPLPALAAVPPSIAIPVLTLAAAGFKMNAALISALIAVTGITVNASVLTV
ncbi:MAG: efflux RND transporter permease subunit, partial [Spirochaetaceae bacterium]|nr:efflux RND transporter permease subunit [Spirochaetaceae bacterium]